MELLDVVNEQGLPTGEVIERSKAHAEGICHRTAQIWVVRLAEGRPQVLLQKRLSTKESYPGCLDISAAGHIHAGDEPLDSALRELSEELGIHANASDLQFMGTHHASRDEVFHGKRFRDNEVGFVYVYSAPVVTEDLILQAEEVESVRWLDLTVLSDMIATASPDCCVLPSGLQLARKWFGFFHISQLN